MIVIVSIYFFTDNSMHVTIYKDKDKDKDEDTLFQVNITHS